MKRSPPKNRAENLQMQDECHEAIARLASVDLGNPLERIVAREAARRKKLARWIADAFMLGVDDVEDSLITFSEHEDQEYLAR